MSDSVGDIYAKYFQFHSKPGAAYQIPRDEQSHVYSNVLKLDEKPALFAQRLAQYAQEYNMKTLDTVTLTDKMKDMVIAPVEKILGFEFGDKNLLLEALTHRSFKEAYGLSSCYEKLEVLGDAILDYIANSNLIKYTMFEKYNIEERRNQKYITQEDFMPFDAHQAKSLLTKNDFLAKLICLFGLQEFILYEKKGPETQPAR